MALRPVAGVGMEKAALSGAAFFTGKLVANLALRGFAPQGEDGVDIVA